MLRRTHLAIGFGVALQFLPFMENKFIFFITLLIATLFPDIDSKLSWMGRMPFGGAAQMVGSHRGLFHSYTFCIPVSIGLTFIYPVLALPFFLGYSFHLFADSFTVQGIRPFWPFKVVSNGRVTGGSKIDDLIFWIVIMIDIMLVFVNFILR